MRNKLFALILMLMLCVTAQGVMRSEAAIREEPPGLGDTAA